MAHVRAGITSAMAALIQNEVGGLGGRVSKGRVHPIEDEDGALPAAVVFHDGDAWDGEGSPGPKQFRWLTVNVDIYAKATTGLDDDLDDLAASIEEAVASTTGILKTMTKLIHLESSTPELVDDLETPAGKLRQVWQLLYRVDTRAPTGPIP